MYSVSSKRQLCEMSEYRNMVTLHSRVVPNIAVQNCKYYKKRVLTHVMIYGSPEIVTTFHSS